MKVFLVACFGLHGAHVTDPGAKAFSTQAAAEAYARASPYWGGEVGWEDEQRGSSPSPLLALTEGGEGEGSGVGVWGFELEG